MIDPAAAHAAVEARDARFDGTFYTGVASTGIYCRCICPARTPKPQNRRFFASAAAAELAGFRPCLICRPEAAPGLARTERIEGLAVSAMREIEAGALDEAGVPVLARRLGVTDRHLRRALIKAYGAGPSALAQTHRLLTAKRLLAETFLSHVEIAYAAGFGSLRRFNALFKERYAMTPWRVRAVGQSTRQQGPGLALTLAARGLWRPEAQFAALSVRAGGPFEQAGPDFYRRTLCVGAHAGWLEARPLPGGLRITLAPELAPALRAVIAAVRRAFDLDSDIAAIDAHLGQSPALAPLIAAAPGVRTAGGLDPFEIALRAVLGQQVSLAAGLTLLGRLCAAFGAPIETPHAGLDRLFPTPQALAEAGPERIAALGMPARRAQTILAIAEAVAVGGVDALRGEAFLALPGVGPWTAGYVAMRAFGDPDAYPEGDAVLTTTAAGADPAAWRPWRAYAAMRLWAAASPSPAQNKGKTAHASRD